MDSFEPLDRATSATSTLPPIGAYRLLEPIGTGGMGRVFLAERADGAFDRKVAVKVMRSIGGDLSDYQRRFAAERQILASFDHPQIAQVLDGGMVGDAPYLVMEYVPGATLIEACSQRSLGLKERLELFRLVCGAVQYAHQRFVVHRDLKPSNILVTPDGQLKLLDFGIAKLLDGSADWFSSSVPVTRTGFPLFTPAYAAPEQLRHEEITTATDVFALGAVLYELLTGVRTHQLEGKSPSQVERIVCTEDPVTPSLRVRQLVKKPSQGLEPIAANKLIGDLDTVVLKALAKRPLDRYSSARELDQEIGRILRHRPIVARPVGLVGRLTRKARRHPKLTALWLVALFSAISIGVLSLRFRLTAERQAAAASRFGQEVEQIQATLQRAYMTPLHDIRPELAEVRRRMQWITTEKERLGGTSRGIGDFALGQGYLALGEDLAARQHLQSAWGQDPNNAEIAYYLGLALSRLYRLELDELGRIRSADVRESRRQLIDETLRNPALEAMQVARRGFGHVEYVSASLDFFAGRTGPALESLASLSREQPWFYEADLLAGDIQSEISRKYAATGAVDEAAVARQQARLAYARAAEIARSDPRPYEGLCDLYSATLRQQYFGSQRDLESLRDLAIASCGQALQANSDRPRAHLRLGQVHWLWSDHASGLGIDPEFGLQTARNHLQTAASLDQRNAEPWVVLGATYRTEATYLSSRGGDPAESFAKALECYEQATAIDPREVTAYRNLSILELYLGDFERRRGGDGQPHFEKAISAASHAVDLQPGLVGAWVNLGIGHEQLAILRRERGENAIFHFDEGAKSLEKAIEINDQFYTAHYNLGQLLLERAEMVLANGNNPSALTARAKPLLTAAKEAWPDYAPTFFLHVQADTLLARWAVFEERDPTLYLEQATGWARRALAIGSDGPDGFVIASRVHILSAQWSEANGVDPSGHLERAFRLIDRALAVNSSLAQAYKRRAEAHLIAAMWATRGSCGADSLWTPGLEATSQALEINSADAETYLIVGWLEFTRSRRSCDGSVAAGLARASRAVKEAQRIRTDLVAAERLSSRIQNATLTSP